jgi:hypothetical protein
MDSNSMKNGGKLEIWRFKSLNKLWDFREPPAPIRRVSEPASRGGLRPCGGSKVVPHWERDVYWVVLDSVTAQLCQGTESSAACHVILFETCALAT